MPKNIKEITILILVIAVAAAAGWSFFLRKAAVNERLLAEDTLFNETILNKKAKEKLSRAEKEKEGLQKSVDSLAEKARALDIEIAGYKKEVYGLKDRLSAIDNDFSSTRSRIEIAESSIDNLENRIAYVINEVRKNSEKLTLLKKTRDALEQQLEEYSRKRTVKAAAKRTGRNFTGKTAAADSYSEPLGEVLTINREFAFLVISLGKKDGITEGMVFDIKRDNRDLGRLRVETVRENISAAALIDKDTLSEIRAGDKILPGSKA